MTMTAKCCLVLILDEVCTKQEYKHRHLENRHLQNRLNEMIKEIQRT